MIETIQPEMLYRSRFSAPCYTAAIGALAGGSVLVLELVVVAVLDARLGTLGTTPLRFAAIGGIAGVMGSMLASLLLTVARFKLGVAARVLYSASVSTYMIVVLLALGQANIRWLPGDVYSLPSALALLTAVVISAAFMRALSAYLSRERNIPSPQVVLGSTVVVCLGLLGTSFLLDALWRPAFDTTLEIWSPRVPPVPGEVSMHPSGERRLIVVGVDSADWSVIDPLIAAGEMPRLEGLIAKGIRGVLRTSTSSSPEDWTTIMTGQPVEVHGIDGWERAFSNNRRSKALWEILSSHGWNAITINVPATFPAESDVGPFLAGMPIPELAWRTYRGWVVFSGASPDPLGPRPLLLVRKLKENIRYRASFRAIPEGPDDLAAKRTVLYEIWRRFDETSALAAAFGAGGVEVFSLDLLLKTDGGRRIQAFVPDGSSTPLFTLTEGLWSPWLRVRGPDSLAWLTRVFVDSLHPAGVRVLFRPLIAERFAGQSNPPDLLDLPGTSAAPYLAEGMSFELTHTPQTLAFTEGDQLEVAALQASNSVALMDRLAWDALVQVFTFTDRIQHAFWMFRVGVPADYVSYFRTHTPHRPYSELAVRWAAGAIDRGYQAFDAHLGEILSRARSDTFVAVVSDHGTQPGEGLIGAHDSEGIYVFAGPHMPPDHSVGPTLSQVDVLPLILAHLSLPASKRMPGHVPDGLAPRQQDGTLLPLVEPIATYRDRAAGETLTGLDDRTRSLLRSLGYIY